MNGTGIEDTIPGLRELLERQVSAKASSQMKIPVAGRNPTFLPVWPPGVFLDCSPKLRRRQRTALRKPLRRSRRINPDEDTTDVKDNGANGGRHELYSASVPGTET